MALSPGTRLGIYDVVAPIGEGGMGQVFRARDTKLNRNVALKVLPDSFANDADRLARFTREAQTLASLNHPNIAQIHGIEESAGLRALVMEFVEGEDLAQRLSRGPIPIDEALPIAKQIAEALEAAHEQGIIHRDLKPANVKLRPDGTVKVLDFGLAKAMDPPAVSEVSQSPTITTPAMTQAGVILGTAAYMAPEQARGRALDKRADVWAFGCVLYEMLTGTRAFEGSEVTDVLVAVVRDDPEWSRLPADTPPSIQRLLRRSLKKDRRQRLADMADVRLELEDTADEGRRADSAAMTVTPLWRRKSVWVSAAAVALLITAALGFAGRLAPRSDRQIVSFDIAPPAGTTLDWAQPVSPDGRTVAFIATADGKSRIYVRPLDAATARALPGTDGATRSFWSPDSQHVAFFSEGNLNEIAIDGSTPRLIARGPFRDGAWSASGVILVGGQRGRALLRVSERGGEPTAETTLDASLGEVSHDYPEFLPDARHYVYLARSDGRADDFTTYVGTLGSAERRALPGIRAAVKYSPTGHLLFLRGTTLMAQPFDRDRLELSGGAFPIAEGAMGGRVASFSISHNGTLAYLSRTSLNARLTWFDRSGTQLRPPTPAGVFENPVLSPDGRFVAFERGSPPDLWTFDFNRPMAVKLASDLADDRQPQWSPDGQAIAFTSNRGGFQGVYERTVGANGDDRLLFRGDASMILSDWSRDGKYLAYSAGGDLWALPMSGPRTPLQLTTSLFQESAAMFSPDGRFIAYGSSESSGISRAGEGDIFVQSFPQRAYRRQVSTAGGVLPVWSADGKELFYIAADGMLMAAPVELRGSVLDVGEAKPLFRPNFRETTLATRARYAVSRDGRFLIREGTSDLSVGVIVNWFELMKRGGATNER